MPFLDTLRELSTRKIREEANLRFYLGLAGDGDLVRATERTMFGPEATPEQIRLGREFLEPRFPPYSREDLSRLSMCHLVVMLPGAPQMLEIRPAPVAMVSHPRDVIPVILHHRPAWKLVLARNFPAFREAVAERLIHEVSRVNAEFAILSTLPHTFPLPPAWFPIMAGTNLFMLTKNQALLICRLAAAYGMDLDPKQRIPEVVPVVGSAFGWRAVARSLAGLLPGGVGAVINGTVAYSGTYVVGKAAQQYYREGHRPSREQMRVLYEEAAARARSVVKSAIERVRRLPEKEAELPALQPATGEAEVEEEGI
jgi:uncharacterized protein (DUF697 family)